MERNLLIRLVSEAQKGDETAMNELFTAFYNDVYYFALKTVKDTDTACDVTQETFLEIIRTIGNLKEPAAFVTWMKQITYHQCTRYFKKKKDVQVEEDEDGHTIFDTLADESEDSIPSEVYEKEEFRNTIIAMINQLTEEQRSVVMMYYYDELSVGQIAEIQGVSEGTVKSRLNYARKAIKKAVEDYERTYDIKLHSVSFLPLFLLFFGKEHMPAAKAAEIGAVVSETASAAANGATVAGGIGAVASVPATAATAGLGLAAKIAALPLVTKLAAAIVALLLVVAGCIGWMGNWDEPSDVPQEDDGYETDASNMPNTEDAAVNDQEAYWELDGFCDSCGAEWDFEHCICEVCFFQKHTHGEGSACGTCTVCGDDKLLIIDLDGWGRCDLCGEEQCGTNHPHLTQAGFEYCFICGAWLDEPIPILGTPAISVEVNGETAILQIVPVEGAVTYELQINGRECRYDAATTTVTISRDMLDVGENTIVVYAMNDIGYSPASNAVVVGRLADPEYLATGTGFEFPWGDVENARGYIIYGVDGEYLATIGLGESYDFSSVYTEDGFYFPSVQAFADGWISSEKCGIPVNIGRHDGPVGN